jgi:uncharacterized NAD(P)/FAD-binding protein YdhS
MINDTPTVAIIGGGLSGTLLAVQLLRNARYPVRVKVVEPRPRLGRGIAYSTVSNEHLLNVPASNMSALPEEPGHFLEWLRMSNHSTVPGYTFIPRPVYARYIDEVLRDARMNCIQGVGVEHIRDRAVRLTPSPNGFVIAMDSHAQFCAKVIVLALGNAPATDPFGTTNNIEIHNAWAANIIQQYRRRAPSFLLGRV